MRVPESEVPHEPNVVIAETPSAAAGSLPTSALTRPRRRPVVLDHAGDPSTVILSEPPVPRPEHSALFWRKNMAREKNHDLHSL